MNSRQRKDGYLDTAGMTKLPSGDSKSLSHQNREKRENQSRKHKQKIRANDSRFVSRAARGVSVADANGHGERQDADEE